MRKFKVLILTEGGKYIGYGHITRCFSLYQAFKAKKYDVLFAVNGGPKSSIKRILENVPVEFFDWINCKNRFNKLLSRADVCVVDSYLAKKEIYGIVSKKVGVPVYIDDNMRLDYPKGVVVNGSIFADKMPYNKHKGSQYLLGSKYIPLRKEFWSIPKKKISRNINNILITFGGDDMADMTPKVLDVVAKKYPDIIKTVLIGHGFRNIKEIQKKADKNTKLIFNADAKTVKNTMLKADICVSACGQSLYELAAIGVPTVAIAVADNQLANAKGWSRAGFIKYAGMHTDENVYKFIEKYIKILDRKASRAILLKKGRFFVNGDGAEKVAEYILERLKALYIEKYA